MDLDIQRVILGQFFNANPVVRYNQLWLCNSADFKINITVSLDTVAWFGHSKIHFEEVFQGQSSHEVQSSVAVQISQLPNKYHCIVWYSGWIWTFKESFWGSFSRPIQLWETISINESHWVSMSLGVSQCLSMSLVESQLVLVSLNESWCVSMSLGEFQWVLVSLNESWWVSMSLDESQWFLLSLN